MSDSPRLPAWAVELRDRYLAGEASMFLVHGNVRDLHAWEADGKLEWVGLRAFFERFLGRTRDVVLYYNLSQGIQFPSREHEKRFQRAIDAKEQAESRLFEQLRVKDEQIAALNERLRESNVLMASLQKHLPEPAKKPVAAMDAAKPATAKRPEKAPAPTAKKKNRSWFGKLVRM